MADIDVRIRIPQPMDPERIARERVFWLLRQPEFCEALAELVHAAISESGGQPPVGEVRERLHARVRAVSMALLSERAAA